MSNVQGTFCPCGCGLSAPCCNYTVFNETNPVSGVTNAVNINLSGVGVLDAFDANTLFFRGVESGSAALLSVSLNATNHTIVLTLDLNAIVAGLPQATTTQRGVGETATDAEAQSKASTIVFLTPSNLAALGATTTLAGLTEYATDAEAIAGVSTSLALTPANLAATIAANYGTTVEFADAVARAAAVPAFPGQFGYQIDTVAPVVGYATAAGAWVPLFVGQGQTTLGSATGTTISLANAALLTFSGDASNNFTIDGGINFQLLSGTTLEMSGGFIIASASTANALVGNDGSTDAAFYPISNFVSSYNTQTGYTAFAAGATIRTLNTGTATLQQVAQCLGTLIEDLKANKLPAT